MVEDVPEDKGVDIMHNNALSCIRGILSQYDTPGHNSPISIGAMMRTHDDVWHTIAIEQSEKSEDPDKCELSNLHCHIAAMQSLGGRQRNLRDAHDPPEHQRIQLERERRVTSVQTIEGETTGSPLRIDNEG